jgi:beta-glucanase (GH16 family)
MFGHVEFVVKAAPGAGIVSSAVLQSDCLDEIDWEWLGGDNGQVQSNYFGKGMTTTYNRGAYHAAPGNHDGFHKYTIDWTSEQIVWQIDGVTVRAMTASNAAEGQYPQTPMMLKIGTWSGGDPANAPGTIGWAGGPTDYSKGPFTMYVKSIAATDYSTGTSYTYSGSAGTWQSIQSNGGTINPKGGSGTPSDTSNAPAVTSAASSAPIPFEGTHRDDSSTWVTPSVWPWVGTATASVVSASSTASVSTYPGLPSGWRVMDDGRVLPPANGAHASCSLDPLPFLLCIMSFFWG